MTDAERQTPTGQMAEAAARLVMNMGTRPGAHEFFEEFKPLADLIELETRAGENAMAQSAAAADEGKRLYLYQRGLDLANAIQAAKARIYEWRRGR